ncbi:MAG: hypothetical protein EOP60_16780 [Sphingomonadales bacterium]|nr:MAG: hypothetical protein EOP60_16780 [Sphingomonadales bacterium]
MTLETRRERLIYQGAVPVIAAIAGALAATWFQSANIDQAQLADIVRLISDPKLSADQKIQALNLYKEITDRPWYIMRNLATALGFAFMWAVGAAAAGGYFRKD